MSLASHSCASANDSAPRAVKTPAAAATVKTHEECASFIFFFPPSVVFVVEIFCTSIRSHGSDRLVTCIHSHILCHNGFPFFSPDLLPYLFFRFHCSKSTVNEKKMFTYV